ncbi:hypothetical protein GQ54DRAFT_300528 [Martensiomyces pterosporus]|nr:hypothetical protein GQ54DRAFT_300528 [Martensiomyces pterosporus]
MDAGSETKWPHLRSYACNYSHYRFYDDDTLFCSGIFRQLDKELPKPCQASLVVCKVSSGVAPLAYIPPSVSFLTQLTSLRLSCTIKCTDTNRFPQIFAPTLVQLTLDDADPESVWNIFYDGQEGQTVVFARLKRLVIVFADPPYWKQNDDLPPHLQGAISSALTKKSEWAAGATSGNTGCRVPLFPALRTLRCSNMVCDFCGFIYSILCHNSLVSLYVNNLSMHSAVDAEMVKSLEIIKLSAVSWNTDEESTGSAGLYKSAFASLLRTKTNVQRMTVKSCVRDILFQVPPDIGCTNLRLLYLGVEIDFKSMLRLLSNLKHLVELVLDVDYKFGYTLDDEQEDTDEYIDELQPSQAYYPPVSSTLRRFMCRLCTPRVRGCYTASYAFELALHLPALESMTLWVDEEDDMVLIEELLSMFIQEQSGSPYLNNGLLNATAFYYWQEEVAIWERQLYWD